MKTSLLDSLKAKYDIKDIASVETAINQEKEKYTSGYRAVIEGLFYLERTSRWRESPQHRAKKTTFENYMMDKFNTRYATYFKARQAYLSYPAETDVFGVGVVAKIKKECSPENVKKAMGELRIIHRKTGHGSRCRSEVSAVIEKYAKPRPQPDVTKITKEDYKRMFVNSSRELRVANDRIKELEAQLGRAQKATKHWKRLYESAQAAMQPFMIQKTTEKQMAISG